ADDTRGGRHQTALGLRRGPPPANDESQLLWLVELAIVVFVDAIAQQPSEVQSLRATELECNPFGEDLLLLGGGLAGKLGRGAHGVDGDDGTVECKAGDAGDAISWQGRMAQMPRARGHQPHEVLIANA